MEEEVDPIVFAVVERIRLSSPRRGVTEVIEKLGVRDPRSPSVKFEYAWRLGGGGHLVTIWAEDIRVDAKTGRLSYLDSFDVTYRRGGKVKRTEKQKERAERRLAILKNLYDSRAPAVAVLQINKIAIEDLEKSENAQVAVRVKDEESWHVAKWDEQKRHAVLVRGERGWMPDAEDFNGRLKGEGGSESLQPSDSEAPRMVFPDQEHRDRVEAAAINEVTHHFQMLGFAVNDVGVENRGYDLEALASDGRPSAHIEVKGTSMTTPSFFLTRNEFRSAKSLKTWRLAIVTSTLDAPSIRILTASEMIDQFGFDALAWRCTLK